MLVGEWEREVGRKERRYAGWKEEVDGGGKVEGGRKEDGRGKVGGKEEGRGGWWR